MSTAQILTREGALLTHSRFEYLWQDGENYKRPTKMPAPAYIEQLMAWVQANIDNEQVLPSKIGKSCCPWYMRMQLTI